MYLQTSAYNDIGIAKLECRASPFLEGEKKSFFRGLDLAASEKDSCPA
jgi:hypothetical protein